LKPQELKLRVIDTGTGIKEEDLSKLFKMFGFLDTTKTLNTQGIGLGLHIVQLISTEFGGTVDVKS
jgi:K+-sensing histidine kinase KdpD